MRKACLLLARFCLSAWVGAATLFVVNGIQQVRVREFDSAVKDRLALARFPAYYLFGFALVGLSLACLAALWRSSVPARGRLVLATLLVATSLGIMACDYVLVYKPLERMVTSPRGAKPAEFVALHQRSKQVNSLHVGLCLLAAGVVCWPESRCYSPEESI
jgi:hypothetical protein